MGISSNDMKFDLRKGKKIIIKPDQSKEYYSLCQVLNDNGFNYYNEYYDNDKDKTFSLYEKDNKLYRCTDWEHFNTLVYNFTMQELIDERSNYEKLLELDSIEHEQENEEELEL